MDSIRAFDFLVLDRNIEKFARKSNLHDNPLAIYNYLYIFIPFLLVSVRIFFCLVQIGLIWGVHLLTLRFYSWLFDQGSLLARISQLCASKELCVLTCLSRSLFYKCLCDKTVLEFKGMYLVSFFHKGFFTFHFKIFYL